MNYEIPKIVSRLSQAAFDTNKTIRYTIYMAEPLLSSIPHAGLTAFTEHGPGY